VRLIWNLPIEKMLPAQHRSICLWECGEEVGDYLQLKPVPFSHDPSRLMLRKSSF
jgi:hypothetical protein